MSRIFDALQRSERESSGDDSAAVPQDPDLLKRAERRVASKWEAAASHFESEATRNVDESENFGRVMIPVAETSGASLSDEGRLSEVGRNDVLSRFQSLPISLSSQSRLVSLTDRENPTAEAIRLLGVRLRDLRRARLLKTMLITSTIPQEGKSMISANLACALAYASDARILLVEGDLRRPSLSHMFGIQKQPGLYEWLREDRDSITNIYHLDDAGIWILPAGDASSNPIELLQSQRLPALINKISGWFDWIIIDSPPVLPLADTSVWMRLADGVLLVTRQGTTEKLQLKKGLEALEPNKLIGALVNGSQASAYSGYYYNSQISS